MHSLTPLALAVLLAAPALAAEEADARVARGRQIFGEMNPRCTICHSVDGQGNPQGPLDDVGSRWTADEIKAWLRTPAEMARRHGKTRKPAMVPYPELDDDEVDALATYLASLKQT